MNKNNRPFKNWTYDDSVLTSPNGEVRLYVSKNLMYEMGKETGFFDFLGFFKKLFVIHAIRKELKIRATKNFF